MNIKVTLLILSVGLVAAQSAPNCAYKVGDALSGTYCLSCAGDVCTKCHNGFVDNGRCSTHDIPNCWTAETNASGRVICKACNSGYHLTPNYPDT